MILLLSCYPLNPVPMKVVAVSDSPRSGRRTAPSLSVLNLLSEKNKTKKKTKNVGALTVPSGLAKWSARRPLPNTRYYGPY